MPPSTIVCDTPRRRSMPPSVTMNGCSLEPRDEEALQEADEERRAERDGNADPERVAEAACRRRRELGDDHAGQADDRANREIDPAGDDDEADAEGVDAEHGDLPRRVDGVGMPEEIGVREATEPRTCRRARRTCRAHASCGGASRGLPGHERAPCAPASAARAARCRSCVLRASRRRDRTCR